MKFKYEIASKEDPRWWMTSTKDGLTYNFPFAVYWINKDGVKMLGAMICRLNFTFAWYDSGR